MSSESLPVSAAEQAGPVHSSVMSFSEDEFIAWYDRIRLERLEKARETVEGLLNARLDKELNDFDRHRIRVSRSRVKTAGRLWTKIQQPRYIAQISELDDIPHVIDDLVGVRLTCDNLCDVEQAQFILSTFPEYEVDSPDSLSTEPDSDRQYIHSPKPSGYRAYHLNLWTVVPCLEGLVPVRAEIQVRTLLQDSWGELTHEDTYKPGVSLTDLVTNLSRRMADFLAAVDDLAQDLRDELDRLAQQSVAAEVAAEAPIHVVEDARPIVGDEAAGGSVTTSHATLLRETRSLVDQLTKPVPLASLASRVRAAVGPDVVAGWAGYGTFGRLVETACPGVTIDHTPPGLLIPPGAVETLAPDFALADEAKTSGVPEVILRLRRLDRNLPAFPPARLASLLRALESALRVEAWEELGIQPATADLREINMLSRYARDHASEVGHSVGRPGLDYCLKALLWSGNLKPGLTQEMLSEILGAWFSARAGQLGLSADLASDRIEIATWLAEALDLSSASHQGESSA